MEQHKHNQAMLGRLRIEKSGLANQYVVGIRTIENWQARGVICGRLENGKVVFDPEECDRRIFATSQKRVQGNENETDEPVSPTARTEPRGSTNTNLPVQSRHLAATNKYYASTN
ncbi:MAG: hypothetical protein NT154_01565 [Verrucomicrobia bacterium]|nr:hypothetical protein [Verrucomicrobiota bacterium]